MQLIRLALAFALSSVVLVACGDDHSHDDDHDHDNYHPDCAAIIDACHHVDPGTPGEIYDCHVRIAHDNDVPMCTAERERCVELCEALAADGGAHHDEDGGEQHDPGEQAGHQN